VLSRIAQIGAINAGPDYRGNSLDTQVSRKFYSLGLELEAINTKIKTISRTGAKAFRITSNRRR
jgi:hypothetical protein